MHVVEEYAFPELLPAYSAEFNAIFGMAIEPRELDLLSEQLLFFTVPDDHCEPNQLIPQQMWNNKSCISE